MYCNVLITQPFDQYFTYKYNDYQKIKKGSLVLVSFGKKRNQIGVVYEIFDRLPKNKLNIKKFKIKEIINVYANIILSSNLLRFIDWIADYTLAPKGSVLKLFIMNEKIVSYNFIETNIINFKFKKIYLNSKQKYASNLINKALVNQYQTIVLQGVTGSGKTEVYFESIENILKKNQQALIMIPEISLTPQFEERFIQRFGFVPDIWHSKVTEKKKKIIWHRCYKGKATVIIGARSSLFLPFKNLGLIDVDE